MSISPPESATQALAPLYAVCISFLILNTVFVCARFFTVTVLRRAKVGLWWDDFWIIPPYLCNIAIIAVALKWRLVYVDELSLTANELLNPFQNPLLYPKMQKMLKYVYILTNFLMPVFFTTRLSILALYLRIFQGRKVRTAIYVLIGLVLLQWVPTQIVSIFMCAPIHKFWDRLLPTGHCVDPNTFYRASSYPNLIFDALLIALPLPTVWQLRASNLRKAALSALFLTSVLALIASCYRTYVIQTHDAAVFTPAETNIWIGWLIGETSIYLIVACLPALAPLFQLFIPRSMRSANFLPHPSQRRKPKNGDFTRLVDSDATAQATAEAAGPKDGRGTPVAAATIELGERSKSPEGAMMRESQWKGLEGGQGVLVHTEIIVTTEEKIEAVIGI